MDTVFAHSNLICCHFWKLITVKTSCVTSNPYTGSHCLIEMHSVHDCVINTQRAWKWRGLVSDWTNKRLLGWWIDWLILSAIFSVCSVAVFQRDSHLEPDSDGGRTSSPVLNHAKWENGNEWNILFLLQWNLIKTHHYSPRKRAHTHAIETGARDALRIIFPLCEIREMNFLPIK